MLDQWRPNQSWLVRPTLAHSLAGDQSEATDDVRAKLWLCQCAWSLKDPDQTQDKWYSAHQQPNEHTHQGSVLKATYQIS